MFALRLICPAWPIGIVLAVGPSSAAQEARPAPKLLPTQRTFDIREYARTANEPDLDSVAINRAIEACASAGGGQVLVPAGQYFCGTIHLRSHVTLFLAAGARIVGTTNLARYEAPQVPSYMPEAKWGKWHRGLIIADSAEEVAICGPGTIDGHKVYDPDGEEKMRGPHAIIFVDCRHFTIRDVSIVDAANYAIFFQASDDVDVRNVKIVGGWDGVHFRGAPDRWCHNVNIVNCEFETGDDSIAGRYWDNTVIANCTVNSSCNGIRVIGPATRLLVDHCLFYGPGRQPHRTGGRTNMLSGIILQPGAWDRTEGLLDDVLISANTMKEVASPVTVWTKPGNPVGRVTLLGLNATGVYRAPLSVESWSEAPITNVAIRDAHIEFVGGMKPDQVTQVVKGPGVDAQPLPAWGIYARNVEKLTIEDVRLSLSHEDLRPVLAAENVGQLTLDTFKFPKFVGVPQPLVLTNVHDLRQR